MSFPSREGHKNHVLLYSDARTSVPQLPQHLGQHRNHLIDLLEGHIQRRHEAQQFRTGRVQQTDQIRSAMSKKKNKAHLGY